MFRPPPRSALGNLVRSGLRFADVDPGIASREMAGNPMKDWTVTVHVARQPALPVSGWAEIDTALMGVVRSWGSIVEQRTAQAVEAPAPHEIVIASSVAPATKLERRSKGGDRRRLSAEPRARRSESRRR